MAAEVITSPLNTFKNLKLNEKISSLKEEAVYGFGVRGNKFVLVQNDDPFLKRIWFSVLKFFGAIKTEDDAIKELKTFSLTHFNSKEYKDWAQTAQKLLPSQVTALITKEKKEKEGIKRAEEASKKIGTESKEKTRTIRAKNGKIKELKNKIVALELQADQAKSNIDQLKAVITKLNPKFSFDSSEMAAWMSKKGIAVERIIENALTSVKAKASHPQVEATASTTTS